MDYGTVQQRRLNLGKGLMELVGGPDPSARQYGIGLWCQNRPLWQITDLAAMSQDLYTVSIYETLGPETAEYIINHSELRAIVTGINHIPTILKLKPRCPGLKTIICLDPLNTGEQVGANPADLLSSWAAQQGVAIHYVRDVEATGEKSSLPIRPCEPSSIATINYTSGTTGYPKGVVLTHANGVAACSSSIVLISSRASGAMSEPRICSYMPLAHIYERITEGGIFLCAGAIGYFHGNILELTDDLKLVKPTVFSSVPRLYNRFGGAFKAATIEQGGVKGALSRHVVSTKLASIGDAKNPSNRHAFYDRIWARKVAAAVGLDECVAMCTGSAPIDPNLHQFLRVVFANNFCQGYGLTETYAIALGQLEGDFSSGNCGAVLPMAEACLKDVPEMGYLASDAPHPRGELLLRGPVVFSKYFKNEAETAKALDRDGWFATGDIASVDEMGRFAIVDRKKALLKLQQGEYVSPEKIENMYLSGCSWLATAYVHGDSLKTFLVAILGVNPDLFGPFATRVLGREVKGVEGVRSVLEDERVKEAVAKELRRVEKEVKMVGFERVRGLKLMLDPFTIDNELLTPT